MSADKNRNADLYLADVLSGEVERMPESELLAEAAEDFGDRRALVREFDDAFAGAVRKTRRWQLADRIREFAARAWALAGPRPAGALAALALLVAAAGAYVVVERWRGHAQRDVELARDATKRLEKDPAEREAEQLASRNDTTPNVFWKLPADQRATGSSKDELAQMEAEQRRIAKLESELARLKVEREASPSVATRGAKPPMLGLGEVWSVGSGRVFAVLSGHAVGVASSTFSADGTQVATVSDRVVRLWNAQTGYGITDLDHESRVVAVSFSPDGRQIATITESNIRVWNSDGRIATVVSAVSGDTKMISVAFAPDGRQLAVALSNNTVKLIAAPLSDINTAIPSEYRLLLFAEHEANKVLQMPGQPAAHMTFTPDGSRLVTASRGYPIRIWDVQTGRLVRVLARDSRLAADLVSLSVSPDGRRILAAESVGQTVRIWDAATGKEILVIREPAPIFQAQFSPDGGTVITASGDGRSRIWNAQTGVAVATLIGHSGPVTSVAFSPDGRFVATTSQDKTAWVWRVETAKQAEDAAKRHEEEERARRAETERQRLALLNQQAAETKSSDATDATKPGRVFRDCADCPEMVVVPAGSFTMGSPAGEEGRLDFEGPQRTVTIDKAFAVGKYEVTFAEWDACVAAGGCKHTPGDQGWGRGNRPVINVSWDDITQEYLPWLTRRTGKAYRLMSEAEWEYAARGLTGSSLPATRYWWGNLASHEYANYGKDECCAGQKEGRDQWENTAPVGRFPANPFGLHDMHGNVWEWVEDCWHAGYQGAPTNGSAWTESCTESAHVLRGGSWSDVPQVLRSAFRIWHLPGTRDGYFGFRLAKTM